MSSAYSTLMDLGNNIPSRFQGIITDLEQEKKNLLEEQNYIINQKNRLTFIASALNANKDSVINYLNPLIKDLNTQKTNFTNVYQTELKKITDTLNTRVNPIHQKLEIYNYVISNYDNLKNGQFDMMQNEFVSRLNAFNDRVEKYLAAIKK
jgi:hypothetical protein